MTDDLISRKKAIEAAKCIYKSNSEMKAFIILKMLGELPAITLERPKGEWVEPQYNFENCIARCSECKKIARQKSHDTGWGFEYSYTDFCPNCGADMRKEKTNETN